MGWDIHAITEKENTNGTYTQLDIGWTQDRDYLLFQWLTGNVYRYGCQGKPMFGPLGTVIATTKDLPECDKDDLEHTSRGIRYKGVFLGSYNYGYTTSTQILKSMESLTTVVMRGYMTVSDYHKWDKVSTPTNWCIGKWLDVSDVIDISEVTPELEYTEHMPWVLGEWTLSREELLYKLRAFIDPIKEAHALVGEFRLIFGFSE